MRRMRGRTLAALVLVLLTGCSGSSTSTRPTSQDEPTSRSDEVRTADTRCDPLPDMPQGQVAYTHVREDDTRAIYLMQPDGTHRRCLVDTAGPDALPAWSPDGRSIVFRGGTAEDRADIFVVSADGTGLRQLTDTPAWEEHPIWSPDGRHIAYQRSRLPSEPPWSIRVMNSDGSGDTAILTSGHSVEWAELHDWSPDGRTLLLFVDNGGGGNLSAMAPDGTNLRLLRSGPGDFGSGAVYSPDGKSLVFQADLNGGCIYRSDATARHLVRLTHGCSTGFRLSWSPNGERIIWAGGDGPADLQSMLRDGSQRHTLVDSADVSDVDWQPRPST